MKNSSTKVNRKEKLIEVYCCFHAEGCFNPKFMRSALITISYPTLT